MAVVRLGAVADYPSVEDCFTSYPDSCKRPGHDFQFIYTILSQIMHLDVHLIEYKSYKDLFLALDQDDIDIIGDSLYYDEELFSPNWKPLFLFSQSTLGFVVKSEERKCAFTEQNSLFSIFSWQVWLIIMMITISFCFVKTIINRLNSNEALHAFGMFQRTLLLWSLIVSVIIELYGNLITVKTYLTYYPTSPFGNLTDLGEKLLSKECKFVILDKYRYNPDINSLFFNVTHNRSWGTYFQKASHLNPPVLVSDRKDFANFISSEACFVGIDFIVDHPISFYSHLCNIEMKVFPDEIPSKRIVYYHKLRDKQLTGILNDVVSSPSLMVYYPYLVKQYAVREDCVGTAKKELTSISLINLQEPFYCIFGILFMLLVFITVYRCCLFHIKYDVYFCS